jgi:hypothetical protein
MSDEEWAFFELFVVEKGPRRERPPRDHGLVLGGGLDCPDRDGLA